MDARGPKLRDAKCKTLLLLIPHVFAEMMIRRRRQKKGRKFLEEGEKHNLSSKFEYKLKTMITKFCLFVFVGWIDFCSRWV